MMVKLIGGKNIINQREKILAECELESLKEEESREPMIKQVCLSIFEEFPKKKYI